MKKNLISLDIKNNVVVNRQLNNTIMSIINNKSINGSGVNYRKSSRWSSYVSPKIGLNGFPKRSQFEARALTAKAATYCEIINTAHWYSRIDE